MATVSACVYPEDGYAWWLTPGQRNEFFVPNITDQEVKFFIHAPPDYFRGTGGCLPEPVDIPHSNSRMFASTSTSVRGSNEAPKDSQLRAVSCCLKYSTQLSNIFSLQWTGSPFPLHIVSSTEVHRLPMLRTSWNSFFTLLEVTAASISLATQTQHFPRTPQGLPSLDVVDAIFSNARPYISKAGVLAPLS